MLNQLQVFRAIFSGLIFAQILWQPAYSQPTYPALPDEDYSVYTTILNDFSKCTNEQYAYRRNWLLLIKTVTQEKGKHSFRFDFPKAQKNLASLTSPKETFYQEPGWKTFIAAIDTNQFTNYEIKHPLELACRKNELWTAQQDDYYFSKENHRSRGFYALRNDYKNFGSLISLSKVAYSADQQKALCYYSELSDGRSGAGYLVFLERKKDTWKVVGSARLWIS
ncbi:hypothetical protein [Spirosoma litoris]